MAHKNLATLALHADNDVPQESDVAPPIHLSTVPFPKYHRKRRNSRTCTLIRGPTLTYASGLAAVNAYLLFLKPKRVAIGSGYYGSRQVVELYQQLTGFQVIGLDDLDALREGDVVHLETPVNPTGEASSISMEVWLGLLSLRTLELRVQRQSENATELVRWIDECLQSETDNVVKQTVAAIRHASPQNEDMHWLCQQMPNGVGPVFAL
ncbi:uncharacterized protein N7458_003375 [Penicillium daleae]|uniref:Uncharacterized protein n=1 Tax=Penicillium daleae TaxID=63821 RepID=A0AAD6CGD3_9EURO|nr:uncharacterized protein N7458_003375 [Penicillium daleae]KAJ5461823.1 hypothetical protein N7458_003375 [Penicillium daleae]